MEGPPLFHIKHGYLRSDPEETVHVRLVSGKDGAGTAGTLTRRYAAGTTEYQLEENLADHKAALLLYAGSKYQINRSCYQRDGWMIHVFHDNLAGLVIAECEPQVGQTAAPPPPNWLGDVSTADETVSDLRLAKLAYELNSAKLLEPIWKLLTWHIPRVVITGGPGSGKSGVIQALKNNPLFSACHFVPEVPTIVFQSVGRPGDEALYQNRFTRSIGNIQVEFETIAEIHARNSGHLALVMDRGLADGFAYNDRFEQTMGMSRHTIHGRYSLVIYMMMPGEKLYNTHRANNPARIESHLEAVRLGQRTYAAWEEHPNFALIHSSSSWTKRVEQVEDVLQQFLGTS